MAKETVIFNTFDYSKIGLGEITAENIRLMLYKLWTNKEFAWSLLAYYMGYTPEHQFQSMLVY